MSVLDDFTRTGDRPRPKSHRRKKKGRTGVTLILVLVLFAGLGLGGWRGYVWLQGQFAAPDYQGSGEGEVSVDVPDGSLLADIGNILYKADVVKSGAAFVEAAAENPDSKNIQPGTYKMRLKMSAKAAITLMLSPESKQKSGILISPGLTKWDVYKTLSDATGIPKEDFEKAGEDPEALGVPSEWFQRNDDHDVVKSIEGFLFPDTYEFPKGADAETILKQMVKEFLDVTDKMNFTATIKEKQPDLSPYEALITASLAQAEAGNSEDLPKIVRVAYNRIRQCDCKEFVTGYLQYDVTWNYGELEAGREPKKSGSMSTEELENPRNKWSTHAYKGLPPTAINSPPKAALEATLDPPEGMWLYFVAIDKEGHSAFAETLAEHRQNEQKAKEAGIL